MNEVQRRLLLPMLPKLLFTQVLHEGECCSGVVQAKDLEKITLVET